MYNVIRRLNIKKCTLLQNTLLSSSRQIGIQLKQKSKPSTFSRNIQINYPALTHHSNCWKCAENVRPNKFFCDNCHVIQKSDTDVDYFNLFGIEESFEINEDELSTKFKRMQMLLHPDKFSMKSSEELSLAEEYSSLINKAYTALRDPWARGIYLLKKKGIIVGEETTVSNPHLLMYVMERNEAIAAANEVNKLLKVDIANQADITTGIINIAGAFTADNFELVKNELIKLKYFLNIDAKIRDRKLEFDIVE